MIRSNNKDLVIAIFLFCLIGVSLTKEPLQLITASTLPDSDVSPMSGSIKGGTRIYIKGVGFDTIA